MIVRVATAAELQDLGERAVDQARADGEPVELRLAPGRYESVPIVLGTHGPAIPALTLRAVNPERPPRLADLSLALRARHVRVEDLIIGPARGELPIAQLEGERIELRRTGVVGCRLDAPPGGRLVALRAIGGEATATLEGCWLADDHAPEGVLIAWEADPPGFATVELSGVAFRANEASITLLPAARAVRLRSCLLVAAEPGRTFLALTAPEATATFEDCRAEWPGERILVPYGATTGTPELPGVTRVEAPG